MFNNLGPLLTVSSNRLVIFLDLIYKTTGNIDRVHLPIILIFDHKLERDIFEQPVAQIFLFDRAFHIVTPRHVNFAIFVFESFHFFHKVSGRSNGNSLDGGFCPGVVEANVTLGFPFVTETVV